jgi:hypothetical protein
VTWRHVRGQSDAAEGELIAITDNLVNTNGREADSSARAVANVASFQRAAVGGARNHSRAAQALQPRKATCMIVMRMRVEEVFHVSNVKAQRVDVGDDLRHGLRHHAIDQKVSIGRSDQERTHRFAADIVDVSDNLERRKRSIPPAINGPFVERRVLRRVDHSIACQSLRGRWRGTTEKGK